MLNVSSHCPASGGDGAGADLELSTVPCYLEIVLPRDYQILK